MDMPIKIAVLGDSQVGKTSLLQSFCDKEFPVEPPRCLPKTECSLNVDGRMVTLDLLDVSISRNLAEQMRHVFESRIEAILILSAVDNPKSLSSAGDSWGYLISLRLPEASLFLVTTKIDLRKDNKTIENLQLKHENPVTTIEGIRRAKSMNALGYFECSSHTRNGMRSVFEHTARVVLQRRAPQSSKNPIFSIFSRFEKKQPPMGTKISDTTQRFNKKSMTQEVITYAFHIYAPPELQSVSLQTISEPSHTPTFLPTYFLSQICPLLPLPSFLSLRTTCKEFYHETDHEKYWQFFCDALLSNLMTWHPKKEGTYKQFLLDNYLNVNKNFVEIYGLDIIVSAPARFCIL